MTARIAATFIGITLLCTQAAARDGAAQSASAAAPAATDQTPEAEAPQSAVAGTDSHGVAIFGRHLLRHSRLSDDSASALFAPTLPFDSTLIAGAMTATVRYALGQDRVTVPDLAQFHPRLGKPIEIQHLNYAYRFVLDGSPDDGVETIVVSRELLPEPEVPVPEENAEMLELLRQLEAF